MAIHPRFADAILAGDKRVEFRKRPIADDIRTVVIYATSPVRRIVGEFTVERVVAKSPSALWRSTRAFGGIDRASYLEYYANAGTAFGILIAGAERYEMPIPLPALRSEPAIPQSFTYLPGSFLTDVQAWGSHRQAGLTAAASAMFRLLERETSTPLATVVPFPVPSIGTRGSERSAARG